MGKRRYQKCADLRPGLEIDISRQWTIGPPVLEIWWSCQISGGPDVANRQYLFVKSNTADIVYLFLAFEQYSQYITFTEKDMIKGIQFFFLNTVLLW